MAYLLECSKKQEGPMDYIAYMPDQAYILILTEEDSLMELQKPTVIVRYLSEDFMPAILPLAPALDSQRPSARILSFQPEQRARKRAHPQQHANRYRGRSYHQNG